MPSNPRTLAGIIRSRRHADREYNRARRDCVVARIHGSARWQAVRARCRGARLRPHPDLAGGVARAVPLAPEDGAGIYDGGPGIEYSSVGPDGAPTGPWTPFTSARSLPHQRAPLSMRSHGSTQHQLLRMAEAVARLLGRRQDEATQELLSPGDLAPAFPDGVPADLSAVMRTAGALFPDLRPVPGTFATETSEGDPGGPVWEGPVFPDGESSGLYWRVKVPEHVLVRVVPAPPGAGMNGGAWTLDTSGPGGSTEFASSMGVSHKQAHAPTAAGQCARKLLLSPSMDRVRRARRVGKAPPQGRPRAGSARTYDDSASSPDQVVCRLCGRAFKAIRVLHLRAVHGYEGEHPVEDYKRQFGLRVAACEETCTALRDNRVERAIRDGQHWTAARIKAQLRARARVGQSLAQSQSPVRLQLAASRVFGSWDAALEAAGFDPREHRLAGRWNEVEVVRAIRERHAAGQSLVVSVIKKEQPDLYTAAWNHSGSWKNAMRTAGLDTRAHRMTRVWNLARATAWVQERLRDGRPITAAHIPKGLYGFAMRQGVGGWAGFVQSLGITYPGRLMRRDWSEATVLEEILLRQREGRALNVRSVRRDQGALAAQARKWFGSWDAALRAAGIDPMAVRLTRPRPQRSRSPADAPGQRPV